MRHGSRKDRLSAGEPAAISWERVRKIFADPEPPKHVWERQFDCLDSELERIARTPYGEIAFSDLWYYHHDLAYVELQPELFAYLFPVCLMDWHRSIMEDQSCSHGDSEFHYGVHQGKVFEKMLTPKQRAEVIEFFRDSFLCRIDAEREFEYSRGEPPGYGWLSRFNSLGLIVPSIDMIWDSWWSLDTPGRAVCALQYCAGLMYFDGENPFVRHWTRQYGGGLHLWGNDSFIYSAGWPPENMGFLTKALTYDFVADRVAHAVSRLEGEPEWEISKRMEGDLPCCRELVELSIAELLTMLSDPDLAT